MKQCSITKCNKEFFARGYCQGHYVQVIRKGKEPTELILVHRMARSPEYHALTNAKKRCNDPNNISYYRYGKRGVTVCTRWSKTNGFLNFLEDMGRRPGPSYSLDRIDNNGNYEPGNCRWATHSEQASNKENSLKIPGVRRVENTPYWRADMTVKRKPVLNKYCRSEAEAIAYRREAELKWLGTTKL